MGIFKRKKGKSKPPKMKIRKYYISWISAITLGGIDKVTKIFVDDINVWEGELDGTTTDSALIDKEILFGGLKQGGGFKGNVVLSNGGGNEARLNDEKNTTSVVIPYNGITTMYFKNFYIGTSPYLKTVSMHCSRCDRLTDMKPQWNYRYATVNYHDMNPVHIIREVLTSKFDWGLGIDEQFIDDENFKAAAKYLYDEDWGLSYILDKNDNANDFIKTVCNEAGLLLYRDLISNKYKLVLMRQDYDFEKLPILDESTIKKINDYNKSELSEQPSQLNIKYWDRDLNKNSTIIVNNDRLPMLTGINNVKEITYKGVCTRKQAVKNGSFDMSIYSNPVGKLVITCNRNALRYNIGDLIRVKINSHNIEDVAYRILKIKMDVNLERITLTLQQDIYSHTSRQLALSNNNTPNITEPTPPYYHNIEECCLVEYIQLLNLIDNDIGNDDTDLSIFKAVSINQSSYDTFSITDVDNTVLSTFNSSFGAKLNKTISQFSTEIELLTIGAWENILDIGNVIQCGQEFMLVTDVDIKTNKLTVKRGLWDTIPIPHEKGEYITCDKNNILINDTFLTIDETKTLKLTVNNNISSEVINLKDVTVTSELRAKRAISPANVKINNLFTPNTITREFPVTFAKREYNSTDYYDPNSVQTDYEYFIEVEEPTTKNKLVWNLEKSHDVEIVTKEPVKNEGTQEVEFVEVRTIKTIPAGTVYLSWESTNQPVNIKVISYKKGKDIIDGIVVDLSTRSYFSSDFKVIY